MRIRSRVGLLQGDLSADTWRVAVGYGFGEAQVTHLLALGDRVAVVGTTMEGLGTPVTVSFSTSCNARVVFVGVVDAVTGAMPWALTYGTFFASDFVPTSVATLDDTVFVASDLVADMGCVGFSSGLSSGNFSLEHDPTGAGSDLHLAVITDAAQSSAVSGTSVKFGSNRPDAVGPLASDAVGVWASGHMGGDGTCGSGHDVSEGVFFCRFDQTGAPTGSLSLASGTVAPTAMAIDGDTLYVAGSEPTVIDLGDGAPRSGLYLARFTISGSTLIHEETRRLDGAADVRALATTGTHVLLGGDLIGHLSIDETVLLPEAGVDVFVAGLPR